MQAGSWQDMKQFRGVGYQIWNPESPHHLNDGASPSARHKIWINHPAPNTGFHFEATLRVKPLKDAISTFGALKGKQL